TRPVATDTVVAAFLNDDMRKEVPSTLVWMPAVWTINGFEGLCATSKKASPSKKTVRVVLVKRSGKRSLLSAASVITVLSERVIWMRFPLGLYFSVHTMETACCFCLL